MLNSRFLPVLAATAATVSMAAVPAQAAEVQVQSSGPVVELNVTQEMPATPDIANLSAGVTTVAPTAVESMRQNATQMSRVIDRIESLGIDRDDIQTSGISLSPQYDYDQATSRQVFRGYSVSNRVSVVLRDIAKTGSVLDALVAAGATDLGGIQWSIDNPEAARQQARTAALQTAMARGRSYAQMAGYSDVRLLEVSETVQSGGPVPIMAVARMAAQESTPVRPGQIDAGVTISVKFEMTR